MHQTLCTTTCLEMSPQALVMIISFGSVVLRGKIDSKGCVAAFLEERLNMGLNFILSAEVDHKKKDSSLGLGLQWENRKGGFGD